MVSCNLQEYRRVHQNQGRQDKSADLGLRMQHRSKLDSTARMSETHKKTFCQGKCKGTAVAERNAQSNWARKDPQHDHMSTHLWEGARLRLYTHADSPPRTIDTVPPPKS